MGLPRAPARDGARRAHPRTSSRTGPIPRAACRVDAAVPQARLRGACPRCFGKMEAPSCVGRESVLRGGAGPENPRAAHVSVQGPATSVTTSVRVLHLLLSLQKKWVAL